MAAQTFTDRLRELEGKQVTVYLSGDLKVAGELNKVERDYITVEEKFIVPIASIGYVARSTF